MVCGACGAKIADKAIVCYRCGAATAVPAAARTSGTSGARPPWVGIAVWVAIALVAGLASRAVPEGPWPIALGLIAAVSALTAARALSRAIFRRP